jgi:hypothetical protein
MVFAGQHRVAGVPLAGSRARCRVGVTALALLGNGACCSGGAGFLAEHWVLLSQIARPGKEPRLA